MSDFAASTPSSSGTISPASSPSSSGAPGWPHALLLAYGRFVFRHRNALVPVTVGLTLLFTRPRPFLGDPRADALLDALGIAVALSGQALRVLVIGLAYIQRGGKNKQIAADRLVCNGLFAHCRHPLYVGNFLLFVGLMLIWNSPAAYVVVVGLVALSLWAMASAEEAFLARKFGAEYTAYCARVNRFVPDLRGLRATIAGFRFDWKRVVRKEYGTTFTWTTTAVVLIVTAHLIWEPAAEAAATVATMALAWLCLAARGGTARGMKKSRRLVSPD
ncbi:MAG: methyltransferase family protein [Candidatus Binatia bacterium]